MDFEKEEKDLGDEVQPKKAGEGSQRPNADCEGWHDQSDRAAGNGSQRT